MSETKESEETPKAKVKAEAFSDCGCHRGELVNGVITVTQVNDRCANGLGGSISLPKGAASDVAGIIRALSQ